MIAREQKQSHAVESLQSKKKLKKPAGKKRGELIWGRTKRSYKGAKRQSGKRGKQVKKGKRKKGFPPGQKTPDSKIRETVESGCAKILAKGKKTQKL